MKKSTDYKQQGLSQGMSSNANQRINNNDIDDIPDIINTYVEFSPIRTVYEEDDFSDLIGLFVQSEEEPEPINTSVVSSAPVLDHQTMALVETTPGSSGGFSHSNMEMDQYDATPGTELGEFLARPTRVANVAWTTADPTGTFTSYNVWHTFFADSRIKKKLDNYSWIRCNLHVKFVITASPFYYGAMLVSYRPMVDLNDDTAPTTASNAHMVQRSQRPHIWLYPQENKAGEIILPFFYHKNWLNCQSAADLQGMGRLYLDVVSALQSANGATGVGVSIQAFAWATEVELSGPSLGLAVQADEYVAGGEVSGPASSVARFAKKLTPLANTLDPSGQAGKLLTATATGAGAFAKIASMYGYTNVPEISNAMPMRNTPFPQLASPEIGYPIEKMTLDPKNELTIDPSAVGLPAEDELLIENLVQKESFLTSTTWSTADVVDQQLFYSAVTPWLFRNDVSTGQNALYLPPCAWVANLFENWRGDVIFRFKFIVSKFHRGRVKISFDPSGQVTNNLIEQPVNENAIYTKIIDISQEDSVEFRVPYKQAVPFLRLDTSVTNDVWARRRPDTAVNFLYNSTKHNGMITVRVMNVLTAPVASSSIDMLVSVRGAENLEFANPTHCGDFSLFPIQSDDSYEDEGVLNTAGPLSGPVDHVYLTNYGECVKSIRQLLRRFSLNEVWVEPDDTTSRFYVIQHDMTKWPIPYGFDSGGINTANKTLAAGTAPFNFTISTPLNWVKSAFVGTTGSVFWTFNVSVLGSPGPYSTHVRVVRRPNASSDASRTFTTLASKGSTSVNMNFFRSAYLSGQGGSALTTQITQGGLAVSLPNYNRYRMQSTSAHRSTVTSNYDGSEYDTSRLEVYLSPSIGATTRSLTIEKYCAAGTDFNLLWFLNVPTMYFYTSAITPA